MSSIDAEHNSYGQAGQASDRLPSQPSSHSVRGSPGGNCKKTATVM